MNKKELLLITKEDALANWFREILNDKYNLIAKKDYNQIDKYYPLIFLNINSYNNSRDFSVFLENINNQTLIGSDNGSLSTKIVLLNNNSDSKLKDSMLESAIINKNVYDIVHGPFTSEIKSSEIKGIVKDSLGEWEYLNERIKNMEHSYPIISCSSKYEKAILMAKKIAKYDNLDVIIRGESGTGKALIANLIVQQSKRHNKEKINVDCAGFSSDLLRTEILGYEKGAFTGANENRIGKIKLADGGTLILNEVGQITLDCQSKLLTVLERNPFDKKRVFYPVGSKKEERVDVRIIYITADNLELLIENGQMIEAFYNRINNSTIWVPPLRECKDNIPTLAKYFLMELNKENGEIKKFYDCGVVEAFIAYNWPGNVRELYNVIAEAYVNSHSNLISLNDIKKKVVESLNATIKSNQLLKMNLNDILNTVRDKKLTNNGLLNTKDAVEIFHTLGMNVKRHFFENYKELILDKQTYPSQYNLESLEKARKIFYLKGILTKTDIKKILNDKDYGIITQLKKTRDILSKLIFDPYNNRTEKQLFNNDFLRDEIPEKEYNIEETVSLVEKVISYKPERCCIIRYQREGLFKIKKNDKSLGFSKEGVIDLVKLYSLRKIKLSLQDIKIALDIDNQSYRFEEIRSKIIQGYNNLERTINIIEDEIQITKEREKKFKENYRSYLEKALYERTKMDRSTQKTIDLLEKGAIVLGFLEGNHKELKASDELAKQLATTTEFLEARLDHHNIKYISREDVNHLEFDERAWFYYRLIQETSLNDADKILRKILTQKK
jgi:DNA-binding NtrC family response regulator